MIPTRQLLVLLTLWLAAGLAAVWMLPLRGPWAVLGGGLLVAALIDAVLVRRLPSPSAARSGPSSLALGNWHAFTLRISNPGPRPLQLDLFDCHPSAFGVQDMPRALSIPGMAWQEVTYRLRPTSRGRFDFDGVDTHLRSPLGLLVHHRRLSAPASIKVFPDFQQVERFALLAMQERTTAMGIHLQRRRGAGQEFHQLREYREGDALRQIDWSAVSRRNKLISREYRQERNQRIVFLLDCGRRMRTVEGSAQLNHFDTALNAVLLLSHIALRQGDAVGLQAFAGSDRWLAPVSGRGGISAVLSSIFDLQTTTAPSDYAHAAATLATRQRRRALVVLVTNLRDDDASDLPLALAPLRRRHLVLTASMREASLIAAAQAPIADLSDALRAASAARYLHQRRLAHSTLRQHRLLTLDVEPEALPATLVNRYLEIKRSGML